MACSNTGGEKVFAEEVESALLTHSDLRDAIVIGMPSPTWGQRVVAVIETSPSTNPSDEEILDTAGQSISRFKLPKAIIRVDHIERSAAGKPDYAWAKQIVTRELPNES